MTEIKHRYSGIVLFSHESTSVAETLKAALAKGANLSCANLSCANLSCANLSCADLSGADLRGADLSYADLRGADLRGADLRGADLSYASLSRANLSCAYLRGADLSRANLSRAKSLDTFCVLAAGVLIGYKKLSDGTIAVLRIPAKSKRVNAYGSRKCRAEFAVVISGSGTSSHDSEFCYAKGKRVVPDSYDPDPRIECSHGIHFFITKSEAEAY